MAWVLDRSIPLGKYRIGLDPILGLIPGIGDSMGLVMGIYVIYESARLGVPAHVLGRMFGNVALEAGIGTVPVLGDIFDAAWQANMRNVRLAERHFDPNRRPRSTARLAAAVIIIGLLLAALIVGLAVMILRGLWILFSGAWA